MHHCGRRPETPRGSALEGLRPPCCTTDPRRERLPTRLLVANGRSRCHRASTLMPRVPVLRQTDAPACPRSSDDPHHMAVCSVGARLSRTSTKGKRRIHPLAGSYRQVLQMHRGSTHHQHPLRIGRPFLHRHHPPIWDPQRHHHRQRHSVHGQKVIGLL